MRHSIAYWKVFRLVFVAFSLYLLGDAFSRWDGFSHYGTFSEFLPAVALITILWTLVAAITALMAFLLTKLADMVVKFVAPKVRIEHLLMFVFFCKPCRGCSFAWQKKYIQW